MRDVPIRRVVDARSTQGRVILHLACGHNMILDGQDLDAEVIAFLGLGGQPATGDNLATCKRCPDPMPEERETRSPQQMWRDAGEPE